MTKERADDLLNKDFESYDIILHEMGIPPIHTPLDILKGFSDKVKEHMFVVHSAEDKIPPNCGLKTPKKGIENTYVLL